MPKHVLFVALAGHGHVTPTLALTRELRRRGHHVDYATAAEHAEDVVAAGARWLELPSIPPFIPTATAGPDMVAQWLLHFFGALRTTYPTLREHCAATRPDVICYDVTNWPARLVARKLDIPAVRCIPNFAENQRYSLDAQLTAGIEQDNATMAALAEDCARFSAQYDVELDIAGTMDVTENSNLVFIPRAFQPEGDSFDERFHFIGPQLGTREQTQPWTPLRGTAPLLYISLGSIFTDRPEFYRSCIDAFGDGAWRVAMNCGEVDIDTLGPIPSTMDVRPWFPQLSVLRHSSVFLTHAGMNSSMEALSYGVSLITFPQMPEQTANADRIQELRLGQRLDEHAADNSVDAATLRAVVDEVATDHDIRANVAWMREAIQNCGGTSHGVDLIEQHAG